MKDKPAAGRSKRVGIRDVARLAGVSRTTVSMVLNGSTVPMAATRDKVMRAVNELGYQLSPVFRNAFKGPRGATPATPATGTIGFLTSEHIPPTYLRADSYYSRIRHGLESFLNSAGRDLMIRSISEQETGVPPMVSEGKIDGLVVEAKLNTELAVLLSNHVPMVFLEAAPPAALTVDWVRPNIPAAVRAQFDHLQALGHSRIATFQPANSGRQEDEFLAAYLAICSERGITPLALAEHITPANHAATIARLAESIASMPQPPTALITWDTYACSLVAQWENSGFNVPNDLSIVGMDDTLSAQFTRPPLDSYAFPLHQMGEAAGELLLARIQQPDRPVHSIELTGTLVARSSSAPVDRL